MKELSSAIVVLAGTVLIAGGLHGRGDDGNFAVLIGYALGAAGISHWLYLLHGRPRE
jgi:hypothetical protein